MATIFRWLLRLFVGLAALCLLAGFFIYLMAARSLPDYDEDFEVRGLSNQVSITRDTSNIPHIFGQSDSDVVYALGFAHAQDRLWQMLLQRRTVQGRLSEYFGPRTVESDELLRRLDLYGAAVSSVKHLSPHSQAMLASYARGVNAWLGEVNRGARGRGAPEFFLFPAEIAPWQPADSVAIAKLLALQLSSHLSQEVLLARTSLALGDGRIADIMPDAPGAGIAELPEYSALYTGQTFADAGTSRHFDPLTPVSNLGFGGASNAWAANGSRSAGGGTLLANDPHLGFSAPSIWYLARLELSTGGVIGGTIPGIPAVFVGAKRIWVGA